MCQVTLLTKFQPETRHPAVSIISATHWWANILDHFVPVSVTSQGTGFVIEVHVPFVNKRHQKKKHGGKK